RQAESRHQFRCACRCLGPDDDPELVRRRKAPAEPLNAGRFQNRLAQQFPMYRTRPDARMLVGHMPVGPAMTLTVLLHASRTGLERVMGTETTGEQSQSVLQVTNLAEAHL